jgi:hypothetical protein
LNIVYAVLNTVDNKNNKLELLEYANDKQLGSVSFLTFDDFKNRVASKNFDADSCLLLQNITCLGQTLYELIEYIHILISSNITLHIIQADLILSPLTCNVKSFTQLLMQSDAMLKQERLEQRRAKNRVKGVKVGRKSGVLVKSIFDPHREKIQELYQLGLSMQKIVTHINVGTQQSLYHYIKSRGITKS